MRRCDSQTAPGSRRRQHALERGQEEQHVRERRARAHQPDSPDASGERPRPAPISMLNSSSSRRRTAASSTPSGTLHRVQRPETLAGGRQQRQAERLEPGGERAMIPLVPRPALLESFFLDDGERFAHARRRAAPKSCGDTCAEPSSPRAAPDRDRNCATALSSPSARGRERQRREPRRRAEPFLRAAVADVDAPPAGLERHRAERRHRVDDGQRARAAAASCAISCTGLSTPVDVSAWTTATMSAGAAASARSTAAGSHARPHSTSTRVTVAP